MKKHHALRSSILTGLLAITVGALPGHADIVHNFSAADCIPQSAASFDGSGAEGFRWDSVEGAFVNTDSDESEYLICPVSYDLALRTPTGAIPSVHISVDVMDYHGGKPVILEVFHQRGNVRAERIGASNGTSDAFSAGRAILDVPFAPVISTRYIWFRINVPPTSNGRRSGVVGYQVIRRL